jgi:crotonobetainyl-CoA:carnitine CoA-transferase CaiB-like acyl-CoA transferase
MSSPPPPATPLAVFDKVWSDIGLGPADRAGSVTILGDDPVVPGRHRFGAASAGALAAQGAAVAAVWKLRGGGGQDVTVDLRQAVVPGLQTIAHLYQNGHYLPPHPPGTDFIGFFRTRDERQIFLLRTTVYPELMTRLVNVLDCGYAPEAMARAAARWNAFELEEALAGARAVGVVARTRTEWLAHPQGQWLAARPAVEVEKIGDSAPEPLAPALRPLAGVRVLDCTHVLAGPATARVLAEQGAEVLHVAPPWRLDSHPMLMDTGFGKRNALVDFSQADDVQRLRELVQGADLLVQSWRPGALERAGFGPEEIARQRPGIVYVSVSCYGSGGPWRERGGFEPIGQTVCGLAIDEGSAAAPRLAPTGTLNDYLAPYLASAGALAALIRRAREGGSYHVKVSLTRCSMFVQELGPLTAAQQAASPATMPAAAPEHFISMASPYGELRVPAPIVRYSRTPGYWSCPPGPPGQDEPAWQG